MDKLSLKRLLIVLSVFSTGLIKSQLSGTVSVPGTYASVASALAAINTQGVNGAFTVYVQAAYTETVPVGGLSLTAVGNVTAPITFIKNGTGANPLLVAYSGGTATPASAVQDGIWRFTGSDYITIDGIDLFDPNTTNPATMEYGYGFFKASTFDGCQNNTVQNCTITLSNVNNANGAGPSVEGSRGINVVNSLAFAQTSNLAPVSTAGANSFNKFYSNKILHCNIGIALIGYLAPSPFTFADYNNEVGGLLATNGNTIENFGGALAATNAAAGVRTLSQYNFLAANNLINNNNGAGSNHANVLRGIFVNSATSAVSTIKDNTITLNAAGNTQVVAAIENISGATALSNTITIQSNVIRNTTYTTSTSGIFYGIFNNAATAAGLIISDNHFQNITTQSNTGNVFYIFNNAAIAGSATYTNNTVLSCAHTSTASSGFFGIWNAASVTGDLNFSNNTFSNTIVQNASGAINPLYNTGAAAGQIRFDNNLFAAQQFTTTGTGTVSLLYNNAASTATLSINSNTVINSVLQNSTGACHVLYNRGALTNTYTTLSMSNNNISLLTFSSTSNAAFYALWNNGVTATVATVNSNTINGVNFLTTSSVRYLIANWGRSDQQFLQNNSISNCTGTIGTTGQFVGLFNNNPNAGTNATVVITGNSFNALNFSSTTADLIFLQNAGVTTNTLAQVTITNNSFSALTTSITAAGGSFCLYNNQASSFSTAIQSNSISLSNFSAANGAIFNIYNRGIGAGFYGTVSIVNNAIQTNTYSATAASAMQLVQNLGATTTSLNTLQLSNNTFSNAVVTATSSSIIVFLNNGPVQGQANINSNLVSALTHTNNLTGQLVGIQNNFAITGSLAINNNTISSFNTMASNGSRFNIYNVSSVAGLQEVSNNLLTGNTHSASGSSALAQIFNAGGTGGTVAIVGNTISATSFTLVNGASYGIYHTSANSNTITNFVIQNNLITGYDAYGTGTMFGIFKNQCTIVDAALVSNTLTNVNFNGAANGKFFIVNSGPVTGTLSISSNSISACTASVNTNGNFHAIHNNGAVSLSSVSNNTVSGLFVTAITTTAVAAGSLIAVFNAPAISGTLNSIATLSANVISQITFSAASSGYFSFVQNGSASTQSVYVIENSVSNCSVTTLTGVLNSICVRGISTNTIHNLFVGNNSVLSVNHSSSTGSLSAIFNTGYTIGNQAVFSNTITNVNATSAAAARIYLLNACLTNTLITIANNRISQFTASFSPNITNSGISNTGASLGDIVISGNRIFSGSINSATSNINLLVNSGAATGSLTIIGNTISQATLTAGNLANINLIQNTALSGGTISIVSNTIIGSSVSTSSGNIFALSNTRTGTLTSSRVVIRDNSISTSSLQAGGGLLLGIYNHSVNATSSDISANKFTGNTLGNTTGSVIAIYNSGRNAVGFKGNQNIVINNSVTISSGVFEGIHNVGVSDSIVLIGNYFQSNVLSGAVFSEKCLHNSALDSVYLSISQNTFASNEHVVGGGGSHNYILNEGTINGSADFNLNNFSFNQSVSFTGSVTLIENLGQYLGAVQSNSNQLAYTFTTTANGFVGDFSGINFNSSSNSGTLSVNQNTFSGVTFLSGGNGGVNYIKNADNPLAVNISENIWLGLQINQSGNHTLIRNASVQNSLAVVNNSIIGGYQLIGAGGGFAGYISGNGTTNQSNQTIANNDFSSVTATVSGFGSFYGIYSKDAANSKLITNNQIASINYNSGGFMYGISADFLGSTTSTVVSSISNNTVTNVQWQGPFLGIEVGPMMATANPALIADNAVVSVTANAGVPDMFGMVVNTNAAGAVLSRNRVSGLREISSIGTCNGIYCNNATYLRLQNNLVSDVLSPATTLAESANGIKIVGAGNNEVFYNTVVLSGFGSGTTSGSNALFSSETGTLDLRNNVLVNTQQAQGLGSATALRRSANSLVSFAITSDRNLLYAGVPASNALVYAQALSGYSLHTNYLSAVAPREVSGITENPSFLSTAPFSTVFLHIDPTVNTLIESLGQNIVGITDDVDLQIRQGNLGYVGTGTAPDIGADEFESNLSPCAGASAGTVSAAGGTLFCNGMAAYLYSTGYSTGGGLNYQWKVSNSVSGPFTNVASTAGSTRPILITNTLSTGTYYFVLEVTCTTASVTSSSAVYSIVVNSVPGATAMVSPTLVCSGNTVNLSSSTAVGATYFWSGPGSYTSNLTSPTILTGGSVGSGDYTVVTTLAGCSSTAVATMSVNLTPPAFVISPTSPSVCAGATLNLKANLAVTTPTLVAGSQVQQNTSGTYPAPYSIYYGGQKMQFLVTAAELAASGFTVGTPIIDISFPVVSLGTAWNTIIQDCQNFRVSVGSTTVATLSQFISNLNVLSGPSNYTPTVGYTNTHAFIAPVVWDGSSNLVFETVFSNNLIGNGAMSVIQNHHNAGFAATQVFRADNASFAAIETASVGNINVGLLRPDFRLNGQQIGTYSWSPSTYLSATNIASVVTSPTSNIVYTVSLGNVNCQSQTTLAIQVYNTPTITIVASSNSVCIGNTVALTASGASTYTWNTGIVSPTLAVSPQAGANYSVTGGNGFCPNVTAGASLAILPPLTLSLSATSSIICLGQTSTISASGAQTFTWSTNTTGSSTAVSPSVTSNYTVIAESGLGCRTIRSLNIKVNSLPSIIVVASAGTVCPEQLVKLSGTGANQYTWQPAGQVGNSYNAYPSTTTTYTLVGKDLNGCVSTNTIEVNVADCTGIREVSKTTGVLVYPNPTQNLLYIQFDNAGRRQLEVLDANGKLVYSVQLEETNAELSLHDFAKGLYVLKLSEAGNIQYVKITLQ